VHIVPSKIARPVLPLPAIKEPPPGTRFSQNFGNAAQRGLFAKSFWEAAAWVSSLGEFCDLPGLLLLLRLLAR